MVIVELFSLVSLAVFPPVYLSTFYLLLKIEIDLQKQEDGAFHQGNVVVATMVWR